MSELRPWRLTDCQPVEVIRNKGIDQVTVEDLIEEITPKGRGEMEAVYSGVERRIGRRGLMAVVLVALHCIASVGA